MNTDQKGKKKPGRKRRTAGWTLLLLGLLVAGVWVASVWWSLCWRGGETLWTIGGGQFNRYREDGWSEGAGLHFHAPYMRWLSTAPAANVKSYYIAWDYLSPDKRVRSTTAFFWPIPLLLWTSAALLLRSGIVARRRAVKGMCAKCGYSFAGLAAKSPCPECGKGA